MSARAAKDSGPPGAAGPRPQGLTPGALATLIVTLLGLFLITQYPHAFSGPFVGDDYLFLEKTRLASFPSLWLPRSLAFHYYRPVSRELHYWLLTRLFGPRELAFHAASMVLALTAGVLYFLLARALAGARVAGAATAAVFGLSAWGVLVVWAAGSQDLWMLNFALASLLCIARGRRALAVPLFALALLSKETAAVVPAIVVAYGLTIERLSLRQAFGRAAGLWVVVAVWAALHPMLGGRLVHPIHEPTLPGLHLPLVQIVTRMLLAVIDLDQWPHPVNGWGSVLALGWLGVVLLVTIVVAGIGSPARRAAPDAPPADATAGRVAAFGAAWALFAWCPLVMPSLGWHAYYGMFGMLGAWLALATPLARRPALAVAVVAALALLRVARAETPSKDWGSEWFQRRAANFGVYTRDFFLARYPDVPPHSRIYLAEIPGGVGLVPGGEESPAFRVWYGDTTLHTYFASRYQPRPPGDHDGHDYLFTYDSTAGWRQDSIVVLSGHPSPEERVAYAEFMWKLGDFPKVQAQYESLTALEPRRWDYAFNLGSCLIREGDSTGAARWYQRAATLPGVPDKIVRTAERLRRFLPP